MEKKDWESLSNTIDSQRNRNKKKSEAKPSEGLFYFVPVGTRLYPDYDSIGSKSMSRRKNSQPFPLVLDPKGEMFVISDKAKNDDGSVNPVEIEGKQYVEVITKRLKDESVETKVVAYKNPKAKIRPRT